MAVPPFLTIKSAACPSEGFEVMPDQASDPPHCNATVKCSTD